MPIPQSHQSNPASFDTLSYAKRLQSSGFTQEQAEIQAETFFYIVQDQLVSKRDLYDVEKNLRIEIENVRKEMAIEIGKVRVEIENVRKEMAIEIGKVRVEIENVRKDLRFEISNQSKELKIWFGGMLVVVIGVLSGIMTLFSHFPS